MWLSRLGARGVRLKDFVHTAVAKAMDGQMCPVMLENRFGRKLLRNFMGCRSMCLQHRARNHPDRIWEVARIRCPFCFRWPKVVPKSTQGGANSTGPGQLSPELGQIGADFCQIWPGVDKVGPESANVGPKSTKDGQTWLGLDHLRADFNRMWKGVNQIWGPTGFGPSLAKCSRDWSNRTEVGRIPLDVDRFGAISSHPTRQSELPEGAE